MASVARGVALSLGLITTSVTVNSAIEPKVKSGNITICDTGHAPVQITQPYTCAECGPIPSQQTKKGRPTDGGIVVLEKEEIAEAATQATEYKKRAAMTAHPASQVATMTGVGDKMYYLTPDAGHETTYSTLQMLVHNHPELAFMTLWTPRTALGQFQVISYGNVLALQERVGSESKVRPAPELNLTYHADLIGLGEQLLKLASTVAPYDPASYTDTFEERLQAIIKEKEVVPLVGATPTAPVAAPPSDLMAALAAQIAAESKPKRTRRKAAGSPA